MNEIVKVARANQRFVLRILRNHILTRHVTVEEIVQYLDAELGKLDRADEKDGEPLQYPAPTPR